MLLLNAVRSLAVNIIFYSKLNIYTIILCLFSGETGINNKWWIESPRYGNGYSPFLTIRQNEKSEYKGV